MSDVSQSTETPQAPLARRLLIMAIKLAVSVAVLAWLFSRVDVEKLWANAKQASLAWLALAFGFYFVTILATVWRWSLLLEAQDVDMSFSALFASMSVALFFNNFLPSSIGGDFVRIADTAKVARSKTIATLVVLADRVMGMMALILIAATGVTMVTAGGHTSLPVWPSWLWVGFVAGMAVGGFAVLRPDHISWLLRPLTILHPEWITGRIGTLTVTLERFRRHLGAVVACFGGAVLVQVLTVVLAWATAHALRIPIAPFDLAVVVPLAGVVQMLPVSVNGFGVREAMYSVYFTRIGLPIESAILLSLTTTAVVMLYSLTGVAVFIGRGHH